MKKHSLLFVNIDWYLYSHRLELVTALSESFNIKTFAEITEVPRIRNIENFSFNRQSNSLIKEILIFIRLGFILITDKPQLLHLISIKPLIYGNVWARILRIPTISAISGLGSILGSNSNGGNSKLLNNILFWSLNGNNRKVFVFQNSEDRSEFLIKMKPKGFQCFTTNGSGINLDSYQNKELQIKEKIKILFSSRLLKEKGLSELSLASKILFDNWKGKVEFVIYGRIDSANPNAFSEEEIREMEIENYFIWKGFTEKINDELISSDIVVLPSYYREGIPKSLIEACAIGRPIVTTNAIGCKECVDEGVNGFKVPVKDANALAEAIEKLLLDPELRIKMGQASRKKAEREFDVKDVIKTHLEIYQSILN